MRIRVPASYICTAAFLVAGAVSRALLHHYMPTWSIDQCHHYQDQSKALKIWVDFLGVAFALAGMFFDPSRVGLSADSPKLLTNFGRISLNFLLVVGIVNLLISQITDFTSSRISADDTATFQARLNTALVEKNKELIKSLTPTLEQQKATIQQTTSALNNQIRSSTSRLRDQVAKTSRAIDSDISKSGNRMVSNLSRITEEVKQADDPIQSFFLSIQVPALITPPSARKTEKISPDDEDILKSMYEIRDKDCAGLELSSQISAFKTSTACGTDMRDLLTWSYTRTLQHFFDPNGKLQVVFNINMRKEILSLTMGDCSFANKIPYRCVTRHLISRTNVFKELPLPIDPNYGINDASYVTMWFIDSSVDKDLADGGFVQGDVDSPSLSVAVCDPHSYREKPEQVRDNINSFPKDAIVELVIMSNPNSTKPRANPSRIARTYTLTRAGDDSMPPGNACANYKYAYY